MGLSLSKPRKADPLRLCKERTQHIKQAIDSRYALSAAHLYFIQSLRNIGAALTQFVEAEISPESLPENMDAGRALSPSSFASHSSPAMSEESPLSPQLSCTRASASPAVTAQISSSWDFFDSEIAEANEKLQSPKFINLIDLHQLRELEVVPLIKEQLKSCTGRKEEQIGSIIEGCKIENLDFQIDKVEVDHKELCAKREDASEFITHRAKDFLSSVRDIEHRFFRSAEASIDVSKMLETRKIWLSISSGILGKWPNSRLLSSLHLACCKEQNPADHEPVQHEMKVITWNRSISSLSSSSLSKKYLALSQKDENGEGIHSMSKEFCMISGSHSCTLERLYVWEKKLYDEVKSSQIIKKAYDQKCRLLRHYCAKDLNSEMIQKTRVAVKDLHSQLQVSVHAVDSISKKIERLRDDELHPQLLELIHGLIRMWKAMLECHHSQFITISLAYHIKSSTEAFKSDSYRQALTHLHNEINSFSSSFENWIYAHKSYVESLNNWLQKCILPPQDRRRGKKVIFTAHRVLSPPVFVLCQSWLVGANSIPFDELCSAIRGIVSVLESKKVERLYEDLRNENEECDRREVNLSTLQTGLKMMFDQLTKISEAAVKCFEDVQKANETACIEYKNCGTLGYVV